MSDFVILCLVAPSGTGKSTLARRLLEQCADLGRRIAHTTRAPRGLEKDGVDYHFVDRKAFSAHAAAGAMLEWANVHGECYGTARAEIERARARGLAGLVLEIDYQGARQIRANAPEETVVVFVLPPTMAELERRLRQRATDSEEAIERRLRAAPLELEHYALGDYLLVNDDVDAAAEVLVAIARAEGAKRARRARCAERLLRTGRVRP